MTPWEAYKKEKGVKGEGSTLPSDVGQTKPMSSNGSGAKNPWNAYKETMKAQGKDFLPLYTEAKTRGGRGPKNGKQEMPPIVKPSEQKVHDLAAEYVPTVKAGPQKKAPTDPREVFGERMAFAEGLKPSTSAQDPQKEDRFAKKQKQVYAEDPALQEAVLDATGKIITDVEQEAAKNGGVDDKTAQRYFKAVDDYNEAAQNIEPTLRKYLSYEDLYNNGKSWSSVQDEMYRANETIVYLDGQIEGITAEIEALEEIIYEAERYLSNPSRSLSSVLLNWDKPVTRETVDEAIAQKEALEQECLNLHGERIKAEKEYDRLDGLYSYIWGRTFSEMAQDKEYSEKVEAGKQRYLQAQKGYQDAVAPKSIGDYIALGLTGDNPQNVDGSPNQQYFAAKEHETDVMLAARSQYPIYINISSLTQEEQDNYYYLLGVGKDDTAIAYVNAIAQEEGRESLEKIKEWAGTNAGTRFLASVASTAMTMFPAIALGDMMLPRSRKALTGFDESSYVGFGAAKDALRSGTAEGLTRKGLFNTGFLAGTANLPIVGEKSLGDAYSLGMSTVDSLVAGAIFGPAAASMVLGSSAASSAFNNALQSGATYEQALAKGLAHGAAEYIFEKISLEAVFGDSLGGVKNVFLKALAAGGIEASEEIATSVSNLITEEWIMGAESDYNRRIKYYKDKGLTAEDAKERATKEVLQDLMTDAIGGLISGALMSGGHSAVLKMSENSFLKNVNASKGKSGYAVYASAAGILETDTDAQADAKLRELYRNKDKLKEAATIVALLEENEAKAQETPAQQNQAQTAARADQVQAANPGAVVIHSQGTQAYLDQGVPLKTAEAAGAVLDSIVAGEITSETLSNNNADKLLLHEPYGAKAVSTVLGIETNKAATKSQGRSLARAVLRQYESAVATLENGPQPQEATNIGTFDVQTEAPAQARETAQRTAEEATDYVAPIAQKAPQQVNQPVESPTPIPSAEEARTTVAQRIAERSAVSGTASISGNVAAGTMDYATFRAEYAALDKSADKAILLPLHDLYVDSKNAGGEILSPAQFAEQYRNGNPTAKKKDIAAAYRSYLETEAGEVGTTAADTRKSMKDTPELLDRDEVSKLVGKDVVSAVDALGELFGLHIQFARLGDTNGYYELGTNNVVLDIKPAKNGASNAFLFTVAHEIGHAAKDRLGAERWQQFEDYAVKIMGGEKAITAKQQEGTTYADEAVAREDVACDFIGKLLSDKATLDSFCETIRAGKIDASTTRGLLGAIRKVLGKLRGKGVKQFDFVTKQLAEKAAKQFGTELETAENAVKAMQQVLSEAAKAEKNTTREGDVRQNMKDVQISRNIIDYQKFDDQIEAINNTAKDLLRRNKVVEISKEKLGNNALAVDWTDKRASRDYLRKILSRWLGVSVSFEYDGQVAVAYLTSKGVDHSVGGIASATKASVFESLNDLIINAEYSFSTEHEDHHSAPSKIDGEILWDTFVAVAKVGTFAHPVSFKLRSIDSDIRSQIYEIAIKKETDFDRGDGSPKERADEHPSYATSSVSVDSISHEDTASQAPKVRKSLKDADSNGRSLSAGQQQYFSNSAVRNAEGQLKVVYHGTDAEFTVFDFMKAGSKVGRAEGYGFYFTDSPEVAAHYGNSKEYYLNITKPLNGMKKTMSRSDFRKIVSGLLAYDLQEQAADGLTWQDSFLSNYIYTYGMGKASAIRQVADMMFDSNDSDVEMIYELANSDGRNYSPEGIKPLHDVVTRETGYDGIQTTWADQKSGESSEIYVAFSPEQAKLINNQNPTDQPDIRFSKKTVVESKVDRLYSLSPAAKQREAEAERRKAYAAKKPDPEPDRLTSLSSAANQLPERESDIRFSKKDYIDQVDAVKNNTHDPMNHVYMGTTPQGLVNILGLPKLPMLITPNHVYSLAVSEAQAKAENRFRKGTNYHDMGWDRVRNLPEDIGQPVVIIKSNADPNDVRFVVVTDKLDKAGDPIIAAVRPNGEGKYFGIDFASSVLLSSYGKENFRNYLSTAKTENRILYVDKKRSHPKKNGPGLQLSNAILSVDFSDSLSQFRDLVNRKFAGTAFANDSGSKKMLFSKKDSIESKPDRLYSLSPAAKQREAAAAQRKRTKPELVKEFGQIEQGEIPVRAFAVPKSTEKGNKVSKTVRTAVEAGITPDALVPKIDDAIVDGLFSYNPETNKARYERVKEQFDSYSIDEARDSFGKEAAGWKVSADTVAKGIMLYNHYATESQNAATEQERRAAAQKATRMLADLSAVVRSGAQATQMVRMLKRLSPEMKVYSLEHSVKRLQDILIERYGSKAPKIKIDENLAAKWVGALNSGDKTKANEYEELLLESIAQQIPKTFADRWNAWRYTAMLGNLGTLNRNFLGNLVFTPVKAVKNVTGTLAEAVAQKLGWIDKSQRTKSFGASFSKEGKRLAKYAKTDFLTDEVSDLLDQLGIGKYNDGSIGSKLDKAIREYKNTFQVSQKNALAKAVTSVPAAWQKATNWVMNDAPGVSDKAFMKHHYSSAFMQAAAARGYTVEMLQNGNISEEQIYKLREYAARQALKATFRDASWFATQVSKMRFKGKNLGGKIGNVVIEGVLPFRATPANILLRAVEYSPLGLFKALAIDIFGVAKGNISATEYMDRLTSGLTGSALFALGVALSSLGFIKLDTDEDDEREGRQNYSIEFGDISITLDWLAPAAIPFFMGAEIQQAFSEADGINTVTDIIDALGRAFEPMLEMSMLSGISDIIDTMTFASKDGIVPAIVSSFFVQPFISYVGQGVPTLLGQTASTLEPKRTTTYVGDIEGSIARNFIRSVARITEKIPFVDWRQIDYVDTWGREDGNEHPAVRFFNNFINPAYVSVINQTDADAEIRRLKETTGEDVSPSKREYTITVSQFDEEGNRISSETVRLTAEQYEKYAKEYGQQAALMMAALMSSGYYDTLTDDEKVKAFQDINHLADEFGKIAAGVGYQVSPSDDDWKLYELTSAGLPIAEAYAVKLCKDQMVDDKTMTATEKVEAFSTWVLMNPEWTESQKQQILDTYGSFSSGFTVSSEHYDNLIAAGIDADVAGEVTSDIRALQPIGDSKGVTDLQVWSNIANNKDLTDDQVDATLRSYMSEDDIAVYDSCYRAGVTARQYVGVAQAVSNLKPLEGNDGITVAQKVQVCVNAVSSTAAQDALIRKYLSKDAETKYDAVRTAGVTPKQYSDYRMALYTYADGVWSQAELRSWLDSQSFTRSQKKVIWSTTNAAWKTNPYD